MQKELTIACDIDGTLIDKEGKLDPDVYSLFKKADLDKTKFVLTTSCSYSQVAGTVKQINEVLGDREIKPYIATSCGSTIYDPEGNKVFSKSLNRNFVQDYTRIVKSIDPDAIIVYRRDEENYVFNEPHSLVSKIIFGIYKFKEAIKQLKHGTGMSFKDLELDDRKEVLENYDFQNLFVVSLKKPLRKAIFAELTELSQRYGNEHQVYNGFAIQTPAVSKEEGLSQIVDNVEDVIYFGDGRNDAKMLETANISFARGAKAKRLAIQKSKYHYKNLDVVSGILYSDKEQFDEAFKYLPVSDMVSKEKVMPIPKKKYKVVESAKKGIKKLMTPTKQDKNLKEYLELKRLGIDHLSHDLERTSVDKVAEENELFEKLIEQEEAEKQAKLHAEEQTK